MLSKSKDYQYKLVFMVFEKMLKLAVPARVADDDITTTTVGLANSNPPQQTSATKLFHLALMLH